MLKNERIYHERYRNDGAIRSSYKRGRKDSEMTQKELARKVGFTKQLISLWEKGECEPGAITLLKIGRILDIKLDEFLD